MRENYLISCGFAVNKTLIFLLCIDSSIVDPDNDANDSASYFC